MEKECSEGKNTALAQRGGHGGEAHRGAVSPAQDWEDLGRAGGKPAREAARGKLSI